MSPWKGMLATLAKSMGVELSEDFGQRGLTAEIEAWAPRKSVFSVNGNHSIVISEQNEKTAQQAERMRSSMVAQLEAGLEPCEMTDCDACMDSEGGEP